MSEYFDYRYRFPVAGIALAVGLLDALRANNLLGAGTLRDMLGDPMDINGDPADAETAAFWGKRSGDHIYLHTRAPIDPTTLGLDLSAYGMEHVDADTSAAILGVWA